MKYKRERRSKAKSKGSKLDRRKLKKFLKQQGISSLEAMVMLDSSLKSRGMHYCHIVDRSHLYCTISANGRKHRESRRSDSAKHFSNSCGSIKSHGKYMQYIWRG